MYESRCGVCCETHSLDHCGMCSDFPCQTVSTMGVEAGFDPKPRLEQCRIWAKEHQI